MTSSIHEHLRSKIDDRSAQVGIIGMGYVGLPLAQGFCRAGYAVTGFDIDEQRVASINRGESPLNHIADADVASMSEQGSFQSTTEFKLLRRMDVSIICVPTPLTPAREPDLSHIRACAEELSRYMNPGSMVILESTTYPGTTEEVLLPALEESGLYAGDDFFLAFSPEREDPGNQEYSTTSIPKLVGGVDKASGQLATLLYSNVVREVIEVKNARTAEAAKILENIYRAVNIALVNELKVLFDRMGINVWDVIEAASSKPFGYQAFYPGPGLGGHCIPIDPFYLAWRAREYGLPTRFIELAGEINTVMPDYVIRRLIEAVNNRGKALSCCRVLLLGVAYKRDVGDIRQSPALRLIESLDENGAEISYHDPHVDEIPDGNGPASGMKSVPLTVDSVSEADAVIIVTDHRSLDYEMIHQHARLIVDTRNAMAKFASDPERIVLA